MMLAIRARFESTLLPDPLPSRGSAPEWQCNLSRYVPTSRPRGLIAQDSRGSSGGMQSFVMRERRSPGWNSQDNEL